jgi:sugar lactone lactonase YvrE
LAKTVLITGASRGFGKDAALLFKSKGWNVATTMRTPEKAECWTRAADLFTPKLDVTDRARWLYIASMTNSRLCRAPMSVVLNSSTSSEAFNKSLEDVGQKPMSDGIAIDNNGRVVITDVEHGAIMAFNPTTNQLSKLGGSKDIVWPDGIVVGSDNSVYFTDSSIPSYIDQLVRPPTDSKLKEHRPYFIYRLKPL